MKKIFVILSAVPVLGAVNIQVSNHTDQPVNVGQEVGYNWLVNPGETTVIDGAMGTFKAWTTNETFFDDVLYTPLDRDMLAKFTILRDGSELSARIEYFEGFWSRFWQGARFGLVVVGFLIGISLARFLGGNVKEGID